MTEEDQFQTLQDWYNWAYEAEGLLSKDIDYNLWLDQLEQSNLQDMMERDANIEER
jgi:hypothetical protein